MLIAQSGPGNFFMVLYDPEPDYAPESTKNMRSFRKYHMINHLENFNLKYFVVNDPEVAQKLGMTHERSAYIIRKT